MHGVAGEQARPQHHGGVRRVGAGRDGGDDHVAVAEVEVLLLDDEALVRLVDLVFLDQRRQEARLGAFQRHAVLRALRAGQGRHHVGEVELDELGEDRLGRRGAEHALRVGIGLDQRDALVAAVRRVEVVDGLVVDREEAAGGAVFGGHVGDGGAVGERQRVEAGAVELDELVHHAELAQHLRHGQHEVGRGAALLELAGELEAHHRGQQHGQRLAQHHGLGLDAADAPAEHRQRVDHGGVRIRAHQRVGIGDRHGLALVVSSRVHTVWLRYSRFTWWQMPVPGGTTRKLVKAFWPQRRKR